MGNHLSTLPGRKIENDSFKCNLSPNLHNDSFSAAFRLVYLERSRGQEAQIACGCNLWLRETECAEIDMEIRLNCWPKMSFYEKVA